MTAHRTPNRDPRLDFFRGLSLFIIYVAHTSYNWLWDYIPARFGFSDAADLFVFVSGYAAAIAFGGTFIRAGFVTGVARVLNRCWQLYIAHIGLLFVIIVASVTGTKIFNIDYVQTLAIDRLVAQPVQAIFELFTLTYIPHYLDILPLYIVLLAMIPAVMLLARLSPLLVPIASVALYGAAHISTLELIADRDTGAGWMFNPFDWQLIFYTGFSISRGWLKPPGKSWWLIVPAACLLIFAFVAKVTDGDSGLSWLDHGIHLAQSIADKRSLDPLRYLHFLALAYLVVTALKGHEALLNRPWAQPILTLGRQGLAVFVVVSIAPVPSAMIFEQVGTGPLAQIGINLAAFLSMYGVARLVGWIKSTPWKSRPLVHKQADLPLESMPSDRLAAE
jgi:hypothetical protein